MYPAKGKNRAIVEWTDLQRLNDEELLNDNLISFILLRAQNQPEYRTAVSNTYFFNTYFYEALTKQKGRGISHDTVKRWTKNVDIFDYRYIVVPINQKQVVNSF